MGGFFGRKFAHLRERMWDRLSSDHQAGFLGIGWTTLSQILSKLIRIGSSLILTRLLAPEVYGIMATVMGILILLDWMSDLGVRTALVRHPHGMEPHYLGTGWIINFWRSVAVASVVVVTAPAVAAFYEQPELTAILMVLGMRSICHGLLSPNIPRLFGEMNFRGLFYLELIQTVVGTVVSIALAWLAYDPSLERASAWPIVIGILAGEVAVVLASYWICGRVTRPRWNRDVAKEISGFSRQVLVNTIVMGLWLNFDQLLGLKVVTPTAMGLYALAMNLASQAEAVVGKWCEVYFSVLTRGRAEGERERWHRVMCRRLVRIGMPLMTVGVLIGPLAVRVMYDSRYLEAGLLLGILMIRVMVRVLSIVQYQYLAAEAKVYLATRAYVVAFVVQAALFFPMVWNLDTIGLPLTALISAVVCAFTQAWFLSREGVAGLGPLGGTVVWMSIAGVLLWAIGGR